MRRLQLSTLSLAASVCLSACTSGASGAVQAALARGDVREALAVYDRQPPDGDSLREIALSVLSSEAGSRDRARSARALAALQRAGGSGQPVLSRLARDADLTSTRARALALLAERGDAGARERLHALVGAVDPEVQAVAVRALDPAADAAALRDLARSPSSSVRLAAIERLQRAPEDVQTRVLVTAAAHADPELRVRVAALRALPAQGSAGVEALEASLGDPQQAVRLCAIGELVRADPARASQRLAELLAAEPTAEGVEAARTLLSAPGGRAPDAALALLSRALVAKDSALRGAAAVALMSVRDARTAQLASERAAAEPVRGVKLCLGLSLQPASAQRRQVLSALLGASDLIAAQAATELVQAGDAHALRVLQAALHSQDASVRRVAVDALGRNLGLTDRDVRAALLDEDAGVRVSAASAILAAPIG
jgi:hypothetical protein